MSIERELADAEAPELPRTGWGLPLARGTYYRPSGRSPRIAFIVVHYDLDFSRHYLAEPLAERGYGFLGWNTRFCGRETHFLLDRALIDIGLGVDWLLQRGVDVVVLLGNSGGGSLLAAYHAQSRQPVVRPPHGLDPAAGIDDLPRCELYVSLAAHPGRPEVLTSWIDPAVISEDDPLATDPELDMYDPRNGPPYSSDFVERYRAAQRARNDRISEWCLRQLERLGSGGYPDRLFTVPRTWADLRFLDPELDPSDRPTPACYRGDPGRANRGIDGIGMVSSLRTWLAMWSLRYSQVETGEALRLIDVPALVIQARGDAGVFPSDAHAIVEGLGTTDKQLVELPGDHYFRGPGEPRERVADTIARWVSERAGAP